MATQGTEFPALKWETWVPGTQVSPTTMGHLGSELVVEALSFCLSVPL